MGLLVKEKVNIPTIKIVVAIVVEILNIYVLILAIFMETHVIEGEECFLGCHKNNFRLTNNTSFH